MKRIVLPGVTADSVVEAVTPESIAAEEEVIDVDAAATPPAAAPTPAGPPATPTEKAPGGEKSADVDSGAEAKAETNRGIPERRIVAVIRRSPDVIGVVNGNVDFLRIGGLDNYRVLPILRLRGYGLLRSGLQPAVLLRAETHALDGVHHVLLLGEIGVAEIAGPADVAIQESQYVGEGDQCLNARVPILLSGCVQKILSVKVAILLQPLLRLNYFKRIGRCGQNLTEEGIRIERYGRDHRVQLFGTEQGGILLRLLLRSLQRTLLIISRLTVSRLIISLLIIRRSLLTVLRGRGVVLCKRGREDYQTGDGENEVCAFHHLIPYLERGTFATKQ